MDSLKPILILHAHFSGSVNDVAFHPNKQYFATGSDDCDRSAKIWKLSPDHSSATLVAILTGHTGDINAIAFHHTDLLLATASSDKTVRLWRVFPDSSSATCVAILTGHANYVTSVAFDPTGQFLATGSWDKTAILWRLSPDNSSASPVTIIAGHSSVVSSVAFDPTGRFLATGSWDKTVILWRLFPDNSSVSCVETLTGHSRWVTSVAFDPTGRFLASGSEDMTVKLWRLFSDYSSASCVATLEGHTHDVLAVAFHPTEKLLVSSSYDGTAKLWELSSDNSSANCVKTLDDHNSPVFCVAFDPFSGTLATGGFDHCARLWRSNKMTSGSEKQQSMLMMDILPPELLFRIMKDAPQLGLTCKSFYERLPTLDRVKNLGLRFPTVNTDPQDLVEISPDGLTFLYKQINTASSKWDGLNPSIHDPARMLPLPEYPCDFCEEKDQGMKMQGSNIYGVLFVCPQCNHGLTTRLKEILGETLWNLIDTNQQIMVPRTNGPNELWYFSSRLPVIHNGTWRLRVQSHRDLLDEECLEKAVPVQKLKELN